MKKYYISLLSTDDYIDGVFVLYYSLMKTNPKYPFLLLITSNIKIKVIEPIVNPVLDDNNHRFFYTYSKLRIFEEIYFIDLFLSIFLHISTKSPNIYI